MDARKPRCDFVVASRALSIGNSVPEPLSILTDPTSYSVLTMGCNFRYRWRKHPRYC